MKRILCVLTLLALVGCASKNKEEIDIEQKTKSTEVTTGPALGDKINTLIHSSKSLSAAQKKELEDLFAENKKRAEALSAESYKLRAVLINELFSEKTNMKEVKMLKKDIQRVEALRLKNTFETVEKVSNITSSHPDNEKFADHLILLDRAH